jgi:hypothetical protein
MCVSQCVQKLSIVCRRYEDPPGKPPPSLAYEKCRLEKTIPEAVNKQAAITPVLPDVDRFDIGIPEMMDGPHPEQTELDTSRRYVDVIDVADDLEFPNRK